MARDSKILLDRMQDYLRGMNSNPKNPEFILGFSHALKVLAEGFGEDPKNYGINN